MSTLNNLSATDALSGFRQIRQPAEPKGTRSAGDRHRGDPVLGLGASSWSTP